MMTESVWKPHATVAAVCERDGKYLLVVIQGEMKIEDALIHFDGKDPGMLWRKKAVKYLKEKLAFYLDPNTPIEELPVTKV